MFGKLTDLEWLSVLQSSVTKMLVTFNRSLDLLCGLCCQRVMFTGLRISSTDLKRRRKCSAACEQKAFLAGASFEGSSVDCLSGYSSEQLRESTEYLE